MTQIITSNSTSCNINFSSPTVVSDAALHVSSIERLPRLSYQLLHQLFEDRNLGREHSCRPLVEQSKRFKKGKRALEYSYAYLVEIGFIECEKGKGRDHISKRWITEVGYIWLVNQAAHVIAHVTAPTTIRSLILEKEDQEILREPAFVDNISESEEQKQDEKLISHRLSLLSISNPDKRHIFMASKRAGLHKKDLLEISARVYRANIKNRIESPLAYFRKSIENYVSQCVI